MSEEALELQMKYIVGLGNPGGKYEQTRHNAGFLALDHFMEKWDGKPELKENRACWRAEGLFKGRPVSAVKPMTYMNRSGRALRTMAAGQEDFPARMLVIHDDISLEFGRVRFRARGQGGGHNGVQNIIDAFETETFDRLKIGVGDKAGGDLADYVLSSFEDKEWDCMEILLDGVVKALELYLENGIQAAMNYYNGIESLI